MRRIFLFLLLGAQCASSVAALGGAASTFSGASRTLAARSLAATSTSTSATVNYTVTTSTLDSGTVVREYASGAGVVFGVTWRGPIMPDLQTLLGSHFSTMTTAAAARPRAGHSSLNVSGDDIVIQSGGHMRAYRGKAWIPSTLPAGFDLSALD